MPAYDSPWMTDELRILKDAAKKFFETEFAPHAETWHEQGKMDRQAWNKAGEAGLLCAAIPEQWGGGGGNAAHETVIDDAAAEAGVGGAFGNTVHSGIVSHYILNIGTEDQKKRWLPGMASGEFVASIAMTEPGTGSDLQSVKTTAIKDGDEYVINGQKTFITNGQNTNLIVVVAKTDPSLGGKGVSLVVVEIDQVEGFTRGRNLKKMGLKSADTSELFFDNVRVPVNNLLGGVEGLGFVHLMQQLPKERLSTAMGAVTVMELALEETINYTKERKAFGKAMLDFQNTRFKLAEAKTEATVARTFVDDCMVKLLDGRLDSNTAAMAKWWTTQKQNEIIDECLQLFGGYGFMDEYPISRMYTDARIQKIYGGTNEIMKELISREL